MIVKALIECGVLFSNWQAEFNAHCLRKTQQRHLVPALVGVLQVNELTSVILAGGLGTRLAHLCGQLADRYRSTRGKSHVSAKT